MASAPPLVIGREPLALVVLEVDQEPRVIVGSLDDDDLDRTCRRIDDWLRGHYPAERDLLAAVLEGDAARARSEHRPTSAAATAGERQAEPAPPATSPAGGAQPLPTIGARP